MKRENRDRWVWKSLSWYVVTQSQRPREICALVWSVRRREECPCILKTCLLLSCEYTHVENSIQTEGTSSIQHPSPAMGIAPLQQAHPFLLLLLSSAFSCLHAGTDVFKSWWPFYRHEPDCSWLHSFVIIQFSVRSILSTVKETDWYWDRSEKIAKCSLLSYTDTF